MSASVVSASSLVASVVISTSLVAAAVAVLSASLLAGFTAPPSLFYAIATHRDTETETNQSHRTGDTPSANVNVNKYMEKVNALGNFLHQINPHLVLQVFFVGGGPVKAANTECQSAVRLTTHTLNSMNYSTKNVHSMLWATNLFDVRSSGVTVPEKTTKNRIRESFYTMK